MKRAIAASAVLFCLAVPGGSALAGNGDYPPGVDCASGGAQGSDPSCVPGDTGISGGGPTPAGNPTPNVEVPSATRQELPSTGSSIDDVLRIGGITLVAGAGLVAVTRRRRLLAT